jgi:hypothetical protein
MGFLDSLFGKPKCPMCGTKGARTSEGRVHCPNPSCSYFDPALQSSGRRSWGRADYSPARPLSIRYRNFQGQEKMFTADADSIRRKHNHISARVAPTGRRIALLLDRIQNLAEVDEMLPAIDRSGQPRPTGRERQVLAYHKKHGSTSPLYEQIRQKYPDS